MSALQPFAIPLDGVTFVEASAGTGKTYAIEMLYLRLLVERQLHPEQIVVVTYTNAAAAELRDRVRGRLKAALDWLNGGTASPVEEWQEFVARHRDIAQVRLLAALYGFDRASISTIHGFCQRVLQEHAFDSGASFDVEMIADQSALLDEVVRDFVAVELHEASPEFLEVAWEDVGFDAMVRFASLVTAQPDLVITPTAEIVADVTAKWEIEYDRAAKLWRRDGTRIKALLADAANLQPTGLFNSDDLDDGLSRVFARREPPASAHYGRFSDLIPSFLEKKTRTVNKVKRPTPEHPFFEHCATMLELEAQLPSVVRTDFFRRLAEFARREVPRRKAARGVVYFDDLLLGMRDALAAEGGSLLADKLRARFAAGMIDEFQDTDPVQYEIFRRIFASAERPLFLIGDPKQSIYSFRGADVRTYVAARDGDAARIASLDVNRRSSERLVAAVNVLFRTPDVFASEGIGYAPVGSTGTVAELEGAGGGALTLLWCSQPEGQQTVDDYRRAVRRGVASRITALLASKATIKGERVAPRDLAVLCRTNFEAAAIQDELRRRGVPTVLTGDQSVFESPECGEIQRVLSALADPRDAGAIRAAICTPLCGVGGDELLALRDDERRWQIWLDRVRAWRRCWDEHDFMAVFRLIQDECETAGRLLATVGGERQLTNYLHLAELLQVASRQSRGGPSGLLDWLAKMSDGDESGEIAAEAVQVRLESDADAVVLTTIHKSKGLQYPVVFVPYLWDARSLAKADAAMPRYRDAQLGRCVDVGGEENTPAHGMAVALLREEEMRLSYVAVTRAQSATFVVVTDAKRAGESPVGRMLGDVTRAGLAAAASSAAPGAIAIEDLVASTESWQRSGSSAALVEPPATRRIAPTWRVSSFSGLTRRGDELTAQEEEGIDRDQVAASVPSVDVADDGAELAELAGGVRVGLMVHAVFERLDFQVTEPAELRKLVGEVVRSYRVATGQVDAVCGIVEQAIRATLPGRVGEFRLADVARSRRLDELEFILPASRSDASRLTPGAIADVLAAHGAPAADPVYAERVRGLGFGAFAGFVRGYIDMVF